MNYHPDYGLFEGLWDDEDNVPKEIKHLFDDIFDYKNNGLFHNLNGNGERDIIETIYCRICGGKEFYAGAGRPGSYFTALKCKKCKWESCIHDG